MLHVEIPQLSGVLCDRTSAVCGSRLTTLTARAELRSRACNCFCCYKINDNQFIIIEENEQEEDVEDRDYNKYHTMVRVSSAYTMVTGQYLQVTQWSLVRVSPCR